MNTTPRGAQSGGWMTGTEQERGTRKRARPGGRATKVIAAVHAAALEILQEVGYEQFELPEVAARAGVNKTTVYRRWPTKGELVMEIALVRMEQDVAMPDTGTLQGDLSMLMLTISSALQSVLVGGLLQAAVTPGNGIEVLKQASTHFWSQRLTISGQLVKRAAERGELPPDTSARKLFEFACSPLLFRSIATGETLTENEITEIARRAVLAFKSP